MNTKTTDWRDLLHVRDVRSLLTGLLLLGSFVIFATTAGAFLTSRNFLDRKMEIKVRFPDGTGLTKGGKVLLKGVQVGALETIDFDNDGQVVLTLSVQTRCRESKLDCRTNDFIRLGAVANIIRDRNLVSDRVINIVSSFDQRVPPLGNGEWLVSGTVMDVQATLDSLAALTQHLRGTLLAVDTVLRMVTDTNGALGALLVKKDLYLQTMHTLSTVDQAAVRTGAVIASFDRLGQRLETDIPRLMARTDTLAGNLATASLRADTAMAEGLDLLRRTSALAQETELLVRDGGHLLDRGNRLIDGLSGSWFLRGYVRPDRSPQDRIPVGGP
ncbi:MAG: MCE family protein [Fibrobacteria bacterium]|nr:MCE family protein [Fibrobacteria bacterium]